MKESSPKIVFNPDLFNNIFFLIREAWNNALIRFIWVYGGSSASKTYSVVQQSVMSLLEGKDNNILVLRKYATDIRDSIYSDFKTVISDWGLEDQFIIQQNFIACKLTGSYVRFRGLDDSEKVKGIASFKKIILEEISQFDLADLKQIRKRLRGKDNQQIIGIFNPISEEHWIKTKVFDVENLTQYETTIAGEWRNESGNTVIFRTNYLDNIFIVGKWRNGKLVGGRVDQHVIDDFEKDKINDPEYYEIYGLGNWGEITEGDSPFATNWNDKIHVGEQPVYDPRKQLVIHLDFNLNPFSVSFSHLFADKEGEHDHQFDEASIPNGSIDSMAELIFKRYEQSLPNCVLTGDAMGLRGDISQRDNATLYLQLMRKLKLRDSQLKVSGNPTHQNSRADCNYYLKNFPDFKIHPRCTGTIRDMRNVQVDAFGSIIKKNRKDMNQRADFLDNFRYKIHNICYKWIEQHQKRRK
ncbi:MAG: PBSX family phage terminase large subunit [Bacteroidota bacterium]